MDRLFGVRKGAWTEEEDHLLRQCIEKYGEGKWRQVPLRAGLRRCRKSCRLRWLNYLCPNIKRGRFMQDEVDLLLRLHKLLGNRWSLIAGRLPGRTANDIKNYWNTRFNKKTTGITALEQEQVEAGSPVRKKNEVIKPWPWIFSKSSPRLLGELSSSISPDLSATNVGSTSHHPPREMLAMTFLNTSPWLLGNFSSLNTSPDPSAAKTGTSNGSREMLGMKCPILSSNQGSTRLEQERDSFDKELEKGKSSYISGCTEDLIRSLWVEDDLQPLDVGNENSLEEGFIGWDDDLCLDFNF